jgi:hypothetical protein
MLAMIPYMCIRFQAKFRAPIKEICRMMPKSRSSRWASLATAHHKASPFRGSREALCHISRLENEADCPAP